MTPEYRSPKYNLRSALFFFILTLAMLMAAACEKEPAVNRTDCYCDENYSEYYSEDEVCYQVCKAIV